MTAESFSFAGGLRPYSLNQAPSLVPTREQRAGLVTVLKEGKLIGMEFNSLRAGYAELRVRD